MSIKFILFLTFFVLFVVLGVFFIYKNYKEVKRLKKIKKIKKINCIDSNLDNKNAIVGVYDIMNQDGIINYLLFLENQEQQINNKYE